MARHPHSIGGGVVYVLFAGPVLFAYWVWVLAWRLERRATRTGMHYLHKAYLWLERRK